MAAALVVATATTGVGYAVAGDHRQRVVGPGVVTVTVGIEHSHFSVDRLQVRPGTLVRFVVHNHDPIGHELIVGDAAVHARHEDGREATHPPVPGEVSVRPGETAVTSYLFDDPGRMLYACHLPGHFAYGMKGWVTVGG